MITRLNADGAWEELYGYSRVVKAGPWVLTSGCTSVRDGVVQHVGDPHAQTLFALEVALENAAKLGVTLADVVRTRMYVVGAANADAVGRAHGSVFADVRPAATLVMVDRLLNPDMLVEVEVEAYLATRPRDVGEVPA
jgi:enamine deaminase RidA (YjgF/YER057c/UK114 family)